MSNDRKPPFVPPAVTAVCAVEGCYSRIFTRTEAGTYVDDVTMVDGEIRVLNAVNDLDSATPWVCEGGHELP